MRTRCSVTGYCMGQVDPVWADKKHFLHERFCSVLRTRPSYCHRNQVACLVPTPTMRACSVHARVTTLLTVILFCLVLSINRLSRGVDGGPTRSGSIVSLTAYNATPSTCTGTSELRLSGANQSFQIRCPDGTGNSRQILTPVETAATSSYSQLPAEKLNEVYRVTFVGRTGTAQCAAGEGPTKLSELAPGSTLTPVSADGEVPPMQEAQEDGQDNQEAEETVTPTVFNLQLGEPQVDDRHFCYKCAANSTVLGLQTASPCTIFVTVPKKQDPGTTDPLPDSGSLSLSVFGWLVLCVTGCVLGLMPHL